MTTSTISKPKAVLEGDKIIYEQNRLNGAVHIAKTMLRDMNSGDVDAAAADYERLEGVVLQSRHPHLFLEDLARRLGRQRALAVGIEREVIDRAVRR
jgi:hypothetical protein